MTGGDELDALTRVAEMRTILARAGRQDLADLAWAQLCPSGVPLRVRHNALTMAGYPFAGEALRRSPDPEAAKLLEAAANLYGEREWFDSLAPGLYPAARTLVGMGLLEQDARSKKYRVTREGLVAAFDPQIRES